SRSSLLRRALEQFLGTPTTDPHTALWSCIRPAFAGSRGRPGMIPRYEDVFREIRPPEGPYVLMPYDRREAMTLKQAAELAGRHVETLRLWCKAEHVGRLIRGQWMVSRAALAMLLDGNRPALTAYLAGARTGIVKSYFDRLEIPTHGQL
ncbi:MAG: hypothetical protein ACRYFY_08665, partial [Janthinobacterium lividum]